MDTDNNGILVITRTISSRRNFFKDSVNSSSDFVSTKIILICSFFYVLSILFLIVFFCQSYSQFITQNKLQHVGRNIFEKFHFICKSKGIVQRYLLKDLLCIRQLHSPTLPLIPEAFMQTYTQIGMHSCRFHGKSEYRDIFSVRLLHTLKRIITEYPLDLPTLNRQIQTNSRNSTKYESHGLKIVFQHETDCRCSVLTSVHMYRKKFGNPGNFKCKIRR